MTIPPDIQSEIDHLRMQRRADNLRNDSFHLQTLGIASFGLGVVHRLISQLQDKVLPAEKASWRNWGVGNKWNKVPGWLLMGLGAVSYIAGLVFDSKAKKKEQEAISAQPHAPLISQMAEPAEGKHVARYQKEVSASEKSL